jgi:hypothetical protein
VAQRFTAAIRIIKNPVSAAEVDPCQYEIETGRKERHQNDRNEPEG